MSHRYNFHGDCRLARSYGPRPVTHVRDGPRGQPKRFVLSPQPLADGSGGLESRSEAKRVLTRFEGFKEPADSKASSEARNSPTLPLTHPEIEGGRREH